MSTTTDAPITTTPSGPPAPAAPAPASAAGAGGLHVLVPFDGSPEAVAALRRAAPLLAGHRLTVVTPWRSARPAAGLGRAVLPAGCVALAVRRLDDEARAQALRTARDGAVLAAECGLRAEARAWPVRGAWAPAVAAIARRLGADAVLVRRPGDARRLARAVPPGERAPAALAVA